jgi:hypothetical protein
MGRLFIFKIRLCVNPVTEITSAPKFVITLFSAVITNVAFFPICAKSYSYLSALRA